MHLLIMVMLTAVTLSMAPTTRNIQPHLCGVAARATETVAPGVMLTWDSAITCADVVEQGDFEIAINVEAAADNTRAARIETLSIVATAPRPRNQGPQITANPVNLPLELDPGQTATLAVEGAYELIVTGEGGKAVLVLRASGGNDEPMQLGVSVQFLAPGVSPEEDSADTEPGEGDPRHGPAARRSGLVPGLHLGPEVRTKMRTLTSGTMTPWRRNRTPMRDRRRGPTRPATRLGATTARRTQIGARIHRRGPAVRRTGPAQDHRHGLMGHRSAQPRSKSSAIEPRMIAVSRSNRPPSRNFA